MTSATIAKSGKSDTFAFDLNTTKRYILFVLIRPDLGTASVYKGDQPRQRHGTLEFCTPFTLEFLQP